MISSTRSRVRPRRTSQKIPPPAAVRNAPSATAASARSVGVPAAATSMGRVLLAWAAHMGNLAPAPLLAYLAGIAWTVFYDTIYAHQDTEDDALIGVRSTARLFGAETRRWLKEYALIRHLHAPNDLRVMEAFVGAFRKVFDQLDVVLGL